MHFFVEIAGFCFSVKSIYWHIFNRCRKFIVGETDNPDAYIETSQDEILRFHREMIERENYALGPGGIECILIHKKITEFLLNNNILLMHGAAIAYKNQTYVFTANSGVGKTTHIVKWLNNLEDAYVVNGDKPYIRFECNRISVCGSPWCGKEGLCSNVIRPLKAIVFLQRSDDNYIEEISFAEAFPLLYEQVYRPQEIEKMHRTLELMKFLEGAVLFYRFKCNNFRDDCFDTAYAALVEKSF